MSIHSMKFTSTTSTKPVDTVSLTRYNYLTVLNKVKTAYTDYVAQRDAQIAEWKADDKARLADIESVINIMVERKFHHAYIRYSNDFKEIEQKQSWWDRLLRKPLPQQASRLNYEEFVRSKLEEDGISYEEFRASIRDEREGDAPWQIIKRFGYPYNSALSNEWVFAVSNLNKNIDSINAGEDAVFTISRAIYDMLTEAIVTYRAYTDAKKLAESATVQAVGIDS